MRRIAPLLALLTLAACGGDDRPAPPAQVTGSVDLERAGGGPPDAGTAAGHGADAAVGTTSAAALSFTGRVAPPGTTVRARGGTVRVEPSGRFTVAVLAATSPRTVHLEGARDGHRPWRIDVRVVRGPRTRVRVPERDVTPPSAAVVVRPAVGAAVVEPSPSRAGERPRLVPVGAPVVDATAVARDADGGAARIRLSVIRTTRCGGRERRRVRHLPPPEIAGVALAPGVRAPVERERSARIRLNAPRGCTAEAELFAEATNGHGLQAVSHHVRVVFDRRR